MQLQLYILPVSGLPQEGLSREHNEVLPGTLNCLLQASGLPQGQRLEVRVNDTLKEWQEGSNQSFSWELQEYTDEIHMHLRTDTTISASWRGLWKDNAIFHLGTLPVRVFFNGVEQTLAEASAIIHLIDPSRDPFPSNGHHEVRLLPPEPGGAAIRSSVEISEALRQDERETRDGEAPREKERDLDDAEEEYDDQEEEDSEERDLDDGKEEYDDQEEEEQEETFALEQNPFVFEEEPIISRVGEEGPALNEDIPLALPTAERMVVSTPQQSELPTANADVQAESPVGSVAVFRADPTDGKGTLERLKALLSTMPKKTVIIDLRERSARQKEEYHPLSRTHLHDDFGGCYWDRSQYIQTVPRSFPDPLRTMGRRWERIVSDVDHPDGLPFLENYLRQGYSMIFMDSIGRDEESARRAVVIALQERIPTLEDRTRPHSN